MNSQADNDIVRRALVGILMPEPRTLEAAIGARYVPRKKLRSRRRPSKEVFKPVDLEPPRSHVSILERLSSKSLSVCWSDPRSGHYADQVWRIGLARVDAFCVLTGMPIWCGDAVFRPRVSPSFFPANHDRMILASVVSDYL
ncbi:DUF3331 domain-containing protein [Paraburkholderia diazotrophica]|uniref:DUF3331 domain-containing protein n=1 Tax=Paraburkholderia diazotrophica TaxID=667676 RepID=A0A1H7BHE6_9BURK|nr:DUF3331 domain-containing protein [Paraburkholderia diazotrophica]SEJ75737.1 protein of unknown function [Paraburkholderia diazotrophica]